MRSPAGESDTLPGRTASSAQQPGPYPSRRSNAQSAPNHPSPTCKWPCRHSTIHRSVDVERACRQPSTIATKGARLVHALSHYVERHETDHSRKDEGRRGRQTLRRPGGRPHANPARPRARGRAEVLIRRAGHGGDRHLGTVLRAKRGLGAPAARFPLVIGNDGAGTVAAAGCCRRSVAGPGACQGRRLAASLFVCVCVWQWRGVVASVCIQ